MWSRTRIFFTRLLLRLPQRAAEQLYGMQHLERQSLPARLPRDLGDAAGVARNDDAGPGLADTLDLSPGQLTGNLRLHDIVDAGAAAAELAVRQLHQAEAGHAAQEHAGLAPHFLTVDEVAGIVIRARDRQLPVPDTDLRDPLTPVP